jgi:hypothetical protein
MEKIIEAWKSFIQAESLELLMYIPAHIVTILRESELIDNKSNEVIHRYIIVESNGKKFEIAINDFVEKYVCIYEERNDGDWDRIYSFHKRDEKDLEVFIIFESIFDRLSEVKTK